MICMILYDINYYYFCSIYAATLYVECGLICCMPACAPALRVPCKAVINRTTAKVPLARVVWNLLAAADFRRVRFEKLLAERCRNSYCSVVSIFLLRRVVELFRKSTAERNVVVQRRTSTLSVSCRRERCCSSLDIFSRRVASSWTLVFNVDDQLDDHREFREASTEAARSYRLIWSGRTVSSDLGCWTWTRRQNSSSRYLSSLVVEVRVCRSTPGDR